MDPKLRFTLHQTTLALFVIVCLSTACQGPLVQTPDTRPEPALHTTLADRVMVGYQGWYRTPGDDSGMGWAHYRNRRTGLFEPGSLMIDYWPDVSELGEDEKFATVFRHEDGSVAHVFSSHHPKTVDRHFRWMKEYGIDGAFVQRFTSPIVPKTVLARTRLRAKDNVLRHAKAGAERHGRSFVVMYDLSGMPKGAMEGVKSDWRHVVDDLKVLESPAYQHHRGRPLVAVWGVGFADGRAYTLEECEDLIAFLKNDPVYGGNTVMLGIPTRWRAQERDAIPDPALHDVLRQADILSPWTPGRYRDLAGVRLHTGDFWLPDREWCAERGLDYLPVVFPGFSWLNLKGVSNAIDRVDGRFLWEQYRELSRHGFTMVYQAMFDEMDEGTQIFKTTNSPPVGSHFLDYGELPTDHYLWLVGTAAGFLHRGEMLPNRIIDRPDQPEVNDLLRSGNEAVYAEAEAKYDERRAELAVPR